MTARKPAKSANTAELRAAVPALQKALDVLELLADAPDGLMMDDIVQRLNHTMGEIYRIVVYLHQRGYLQQDGLSGRYALSLRLFKFAHRHPPTNRLVKLAIPMLEALAIDTEQPCHLAVPCQTSVLILASAASLRPAIWSRPAPCSGCATPTPAS